MRTVALRPMLTAAALALLTAAMPAVADVVWNGSAGLSLQRTDIWSDGGPHSSNQTLWFTGSLGLDASFFGPGVLDLGATASYLGYRAQGGNASDGLNYRLTLGALRNTPVTLGASAGRNTIDFTSDAAGGRTGSTRVDSVTGLVVLGTAGTPTLTTAVYQSDTSNRSIGVAPVRSSNTSLRADLSQAVEGLNYSLTYDTRWSSGDYAETNYRSHVGTIRAQAQLATNVTTQVSANYTLRQPTLVSPLNPREDTQYVSAWTTWNASDTLSGGGGYVYSNYLFEPPGSALRQTIAHTVSAFGSHQLTPEWGYNVSASGSASTLRVGDVETRSSSEGVGGGARWARQIGEYRLAASGSVGVGLFQPVAGSSQAAYGYGGGFDVSRPLGTWFGGVGVSANRDENGNASAGTRTAVRGSASASGVPFGWSLTSRLDLGYSRTDSPSIGISGYTSLLMLAQATRGGYALALSAGMNDQASEILTPGVAAGSLVPIDFNTRASFASVTATVPTSFQLFVSLNGRYSYVSMPGRPSTWERGLGLTLSYYIGAFQLSLYDQLTSGGSSGGATGNQNLFFFSVTRSFGR